MNETWYCRACGSQEIHHDAIVKWDPDKGDWEVVAVLDDEWCETCESEMRGRGDAVFGAPEDGDEEESAEPQAAPE